MTAGIVVQARYSSARLPGKVLRPLKGRPMLGWLLGRMLSVPEAGCVVVATSDQAEDDAVAACAREAGVLVHRGPLEDVLGRFAGAAAAFALDPVVRVSGDSPLLDPAIVSQALRLYAEGGADLVTNVLVRSFPKGQSVEVIGAAALRACADEARDPAAREHVTPYLYAHAGRFRIRNFALHPGAADMRLCVDTEEDFARMEAVASRGGQCGLEDLMRAYREVAGERAC